MPENKPGTPGTTDTSGGLNSASFGFTDKRQTNFATIGSGLITVRDTDIDLSKLNRDETVSQYGTMDAGVSMSADKDMLHIVDTATKTADAAVKIWDETSEVREIIGTNVKDAFNSVYNGIKELGSWDNEGEDAKLKIVEEIKKYDALNAQTGGVLSGIESSRGGIVQAEVDLETAAYNKRVNLSACPLLSQRF